MVDLTLALRLKVLDEERYRAALRRAGADQKRFAQEAGRDAKGRFTSRGGVGGTYVDASGRLRDMRGRFVGGGGGGGGGREDDFGKRVRDVGDQFQRTGAKIAVASAAAGYGIKRLIQPVEDYERAIVDTIAVTGDAAYNAGNEQQLRKLSQSFVGMGVGATDAAKAMEFLALAGYDTKQQMAAMPNVLFAAKAGSEDVIKTAGYLSDVATGFGFGADKFQRVSDVMTYINNETSTTLSATAEAMKEIGPYAQQAGLDFENMAAGIGVLANAGFRGRQAGTAMRNMLLSFTKMSDPAKAELKALGLRQKDFIKMIDDGDLQGAVLKLDEAVKRKGYGAGEKFRVMNTIFQRFTSAKEMALALSAVRDGKWDQLTAGAKGSGGSAEAVANRKLDSAAGRMDIMRAKLEQMQVKLGQQILPALMPIGEQLVESLEKLSRWVEKNPDTAKFIAGTAAELSILGTVAGPAMTAMGAFVKMTGTFASMAGVGGGARGLLSAGSALGDAGAAAGGAAGKVGLLSRALGTAGLVGAAAAAGVAIGTLIDNSTGLSNRLSGVGDNRDGDVNGDNWLSRLFGEQTEKHKGTGDRLAKTRGAGFMTKEELAAVKLEDKRIEALRKKASLISGESYGADEWQYGGHVLGKKRFTGLAAGFTMKDLNAVEAELAAAERRKTGITTDAQTRARKQTVKDGEVRPLFEARATELSEMRDALKEQEVAASSLKGRKGRRASREVERARQRYMREEMITQSRAQQAGIVKGGESWRTRLGVDIKFTDDRVNVKVNDKPVNINAGPLTLGLG